MKIAPLFEISTPLPKKKFILHKILLLLRCVVFVSLIFLALSPFAKAQCLGAYECSQLVNISLPNESACFPGPVTTSTHPNDPIPVEVTFSGGALYRTCFSPVSCAGNTYGTSSATSLACSSATSPTVSITFSQPVKNATFSILSATSGATITASGGGETFQFVFQGRTGVSFPVVLSSIILTISPDNFGNYGFQINDVCFQPVLSSTPVAGTIVTSPTSGSEGATVNVTGSNWTATTSGAYNLLFDGNLVAQQSPLNSCSDQPSLSFDVPCGAAIGNHTLTIQLTDPSNQVLATQQTPFNVTSPPFAGLAITTCQNSPKVIFQYADGRSLPEPLRIGLTTKANKRTVSLRAVVTPANSVETKDIDIIINKGKILKISNQKNNNNIITFDVDGEFSTLPELPIVMIQAKHKSLGILGSVVYRVVVPNKVDPEHDTEGQGVESGNLAQNETTSPAEPQANEKQAMLVTYYVRFLKIRLLDQYGESLEDIYNGSKVEESTDGKGFVSLNQPIQSGGVFLDPVGFTIPPFDKNLLVTKDSDEAKKWPTQPKIMPPDGMGESPQAFALRIDDDSRMVIPINKGIQNRVIKVKIVNGVVSITVSWP